MTVEITPVFVEFIPEKTEELTLYISEKYKTATHNCFCGCRERVVTPLGDSNNDRQWDLIKNGGLVSLHPSVGNWNLDCQSHYVITDNIANFI